MSPTCQFEIEFQKHFKSPATEEKPTLRFIVSRITATKTKKQEMNDTIKWILKNIPNELINKNLSSSDYWDESVGDEIIRISSPKVKSKLSKEKRKLEKNKRLIDQMAFSDGKY